MIQVGVLFAIDNLTMLIECVLFFLFAGMFLRRRLRSAACFIPAAVISWGVRFLLARLEVGQARILVSLALDFASLLICYGDNSRRALLKKAFLVGSYYVIMAATQGVSIAMLYSISDAADLRESPVLAWGAYAISLLLDALCVHFLERFRQVEPLPLTSRNWSSLLAVPIISITFVWLFFPFGQRSVDDYALPLIAGLSIALPAANLFVFIMYRNIARTTSLQSRHDDLERYCKHLHALLQSEGKRRDVIHDYLHNLGVIAALIESGRGEDAAAYIYRLESRIKSISAERYTGNREVDAILAAKLPLLRERGLSCKIEGILPPALTFDFLDVCALLSNALDNALEACVRQGVSGEAIRLRMSVRDGLFKVELSNVVRDAALARARMERRQGRGLAIMRSVTEKYDGLMDVEIQGEVCVLSVLLQEPTR